MNIISFFRTAGELRRDIDRVAKIELELKKSRLAYLQLSKDFLTLRESSKTYRGNEYQTYDEAVSEIDRKYRGVAEWGVVQTGNIIDLRSVFIMAEGIQVTEKEKGEGEDELNFAEDFLAYNDFDHEMAYEFAKEAEIEGKILMKLAWEEDDNMVTARFISWLAKKYKVITDPLDYTYYEKVEWTPPDSQKPETIGENEFVYKKFGGRVNQPNEAAPKVMKCLSKVDDLDKSLRDLREIDRIFAAPILTLKFDDVKAAAAGADALDNMNFKIKKALTTTGELKYVQPTLEGVRSLIEEIIMLSKVISGSTGVPVHFLGLPDLLSNRATAENLMELVFAATLRERKIWIGAYREMIAKAMGIFNRQTGIEQKSNALDPDKITVDIPFISLATWEKIEKVFVPLSLGGKISDELLLKTIPGINVDDEMKRLEDKEKGDGKIFADLDKKREDKDFARDEGEGT